MMGHQMSGKLTGKHTRVKKLAGEIALHVDCCAHILNLIFFDITMETLNEAKLFSLPSENILIHY